MQKEWFKDGGCCGCTKTKRRITLFIIGLICFIIGGALYFTVEDEEQKKYESIGMGIFGILFILGGACCPNFCCYGNSKRDNYQRV